MTKKSKDEIKELHVKIDAIANSMATTMATKNDLKVFATKDDIHRLAVKLVQHDQQFADIKATMATKADIRDIQFRFDDFAKQFKFFDNRQVFNTGRVNEIDPILKNHEVRITALEHKTP